MPTLEVSANNFRPLFIALGGLISGRVQSNLSALASGAFSRGFTPTPVTALTDKIQVVTVTPGVSTTDGSTLVEGAQEVSAEGFDTITNVSTIGMSLREVQLKRFARRVVISRAQAEAYMQLLQAVQNQPNEETIRFAENQLMEVAGAIQEEFLKLFLTKGFETVENTASPVVKEYVCTGTSGSDTNLPTAEDFINAKMELFGDLAPFMQAPDWVVILHPNVAAYIEKLPQATQPLTFGDPRPRYFGANVHITDLVSVDTNGYYHNYLIRTGGIKYYIPQWSGSSAPQSYGLDVTADGLSNMFIIEEPVRIPEKSVYTSIFNTMFAHWIDGPRTKAVKFLCKLPA